MRRPTDPTRDRMPMLAGTPDLEVIPELQPVDNDTIIYKRHLGGFSHNDLDYTLRTMGCDAVILAGASANGAAQKITSDNARRFYGL